MANWFVDSQLGSGNNDGTTTDHAWRGTSAIKTAMEYGSFADGDRIWIKRDSSYDEGVANNGADIAPTDDGIISAPLYFIGWPRPELPNTTITQADWTNGSTTVDNIVGITCTRLSHQARWAVAPDGKKYLITRVIDANTIIVDREYVGSTVTGTSGKFSIEADEDYATAQAIDDSAWTIKLSTWSDDSHDMPFIDFNDEAYQLLVSADFYFSFRNLEMRSSSDAAGIFAVSSAYVCEVIGCLFKQTSNSYAVLATGPTLIMDRFTIEGTEDSGANTDQYGLTAGYGMFSMRIRNGAIYNTGGVGLGARSGAYLSSGVIENVNVGVEQANGTFDISFALATSMYLRDIKSGGTNGYVNLPVTANPIGQLNIENYGKVLGAHKSWFPGGVLEKVAVTATNANKKLSDNVLKITPNANSVPAGIMYKHILFEGEFELQAGAQTIKFWLFNDVGATLNNTTATDNIFLEATYVDSYDDTTEYTQTRVFSTEIDIADSASADDWDYLQVSVNPATASKVRVMLKISYYDTTGDILIDPQPVIA